MPTKKGFSRYGQGTDTFRDIEPGEDPITYKKRKEQAIYNGKAKDDFKNPWLSYMGWAEPVGDSQGAKWKIRNEKQAEFNTFKLNNYLPND